MLVNIHYYRITESSKSITVTKYQLILQLQSDHVTNQRETSRIINWRCDVAAWQWACLQVKEILVCYSGMHVSADEPSTLLPRLRTKWLFSIQIINVRVDVDFQVTSDTDIQAHILICLERQEPNFYKACHGVRIRMLSHSDNFCKSDGFTDLLNSYLDSSFVSKSSHSSFTAVGH